MDVFVRDRGWYEVGSARPQTPKNLAVSLAVEAAEVVECFQWRETVDSARLADELADVVLYAAQLANATGIDLAAAAEAKLDLNARRTWDGE